MLHGCEGARRERHDQGRQGRAAEATALPSDGATAWRSSEPERLEGEWRASKPASARAGGRGRGDHGRWRRERCQSSDLTLPTCAIHAADSKVPFFFPPPQMPGGGRGPNANRRLLLGAGVLGGGALLLNWIFGEEEYDLGENLNNKFRPPRPATTRKKKKAPDLSLVLARALVQRRRLGAPSSAATWETSTRASTSRAGASWWTPRRTSVTRLWIPWPSPTPTLWTGTS